MAELHDALKYLGPAEWSTVPQPGPELDSYINDLLQNAQLIVDSVPVPAPHDVPIQPQTTSHIPATKASEVTLSSERGAPPPFGHEKFQKEWGKPMKIKAQDNPLGLSVYKMSGKEGRGAWFARHSIHEGISFSKFKKSLQIEFEKSLAEQGPPGTGNVRGIGGEERVEQIKTDKALVEVFRLSAQFPGPTAARDFVTMLVTSDKAMHGEKGSNDNDLPRHYMIISRPCDHPKTQPMSGFVRGYYESVEFIREVPRKLKESQSTVDLTSHTAAGEGHGRKRSATADQAALKSARETAKQAAADENPVEWLMITRSDPGGGIPRFLVERGTPGSICSDAVKFLDWACQNEDDSVEQPQSPELAVPQRRPSHQSWRSRSLVGVAEDEEATTTGNEVSTEPQPATDRQPEPEQVQQHGIFDTMTGAAASLRPYTPQVILNHLPTGAASHDTNGGPGHEAELSEPTTPINRHEDNRSIVSTTSFASAEDHLSSEAEDEVEEISIDSTRSVQPMSDSREQLHREKELRRLDDRKHALHKKYAATQTKLEEAKVKQADTDAQLTAKATEKHERELKKHEEKYQKELAKIEQKQEKERKKLADRARKQADKDEKHRLTMERDEARKELELLKKEADSLRQIVQDLQKENTNLVIKLGRAGVAHEMDAASGNRSRGNSLTRKDKDKKPVLPERDRDLAAASAAASMKSSETAHHS